MLVATKYELAIICALEIEYTAIKRILDENYHLPPRSHQHDINQYTTGRIGAHHVVVTVLPAGQYGTSSAASCSSYLKSSFPDVKMGIMVGIGGGAPSPIHDIRLGDVVVSTPGNCEGGVISYDVVKTTQTGELQRSGHLDKPPPLLLTTVQQLRSELASGNLDLWSKITQHSSETYSTLFSRPAQDILYKSQNSHVGGSCHNCHERGIVERRYRPCNAPTVHYGLVASANNVMKDAPLRDEIAIRENVLCFETEAAGLMNTIPCLVVRGISDYADSHKSKAWQGYASLTAAVYVKQLICLLPESRAVSSPYSFPSRWSNSNTQHFHGRVEEIERLDQILSISRRAVIQGLGGIGKTRMAIEYSRKFKNKYTAMFCIDCTDKTTTLNSFSQALESIQDVDPSLASGTMSLPEPSASVGVVLRWLQRLRNRGWLLIFDNVDNGEVPGVKGLYNIEDYLPNTSHGHIIMTTRCSRLRFGELIRLDKITGREDCLAILRATSQRKDIESGTSTFGRESRLKLADVAINALLQSLDGLPLALSTAGLCLAESIDWSVRDYLNAYNTEWLRLQNQTTFSSDYKHTLQSVWQVTMLKVKNIDVLTWQLFQVFAFFANEDISYDLLKAGESSAPPWFKQVVANKLTFSSHTRLLFSYGLIHACDGKNTWGLHVCLASWLRSNVSQSERADLVNLAAACICGRIPNTGELDLWSIRHQLLPHGTRIVSYILPSPSSSIQYSFLSRLSVLYWDTGLYGQAKELLYAVSQYQIKSLGHHESSTLVTARLLTRAYCKLGDYQSAVDSSKRLLETIPAKDKIQSGGPSGRFDVVDLVIRREDAVSSQLSNLTASLISLLNTMTIPDRRVLLDILTSLAVAYSNLGVHGHAIGILRVVGPQQMGLPGGLQHEDTIRAMYSLSQALYERASPQEIDFIEARSWAGTTYFESMNLFGEDHTETLRAASWYGFLLHAMEEVEEAKRIWMDTLHRCEVVGAADTYLANCMQNSLGFVLMKQGELEAAERYLRQAYNGHMQKLGPQQKRTNEAAESLRDLFRLTGRDEEARQLDLQVQGVK